MKKIIVFGSGGHASVIIDEILQKKKYTVQYIYDENKDRKFIIINDRKFKIFHNLKEIKKKKFPSQGIIAIGDNIKREKINKKILKINKKFKFTNIISKNAIVSKSVNIGCGNVILSKCFVGTNTIIKDHCIINNSSSIDHDNFFDSFSSTGPGVITGGNVKIKKFSHIGIGTSVKNNITIGKNTIISGNSFVNKDCDSNKIFGGSPVKFLKKRLKNQKYL